MRTFTYPIDDDDAANLRRIFSIEVSSLRSAVNAVIASSKTTGSPTEVADIMAPHVPKDIALEAIAFARGLRGNMDALDFTKEEMFAAVSNGINNKDRNLGTQWKLFEAEFSRLIDSEPVITSVKVSDLLRQNEFHIHQLSITTSVIPVFSGDRERIVANIIKNMLYISYADKNEKEFLQSMPLGEEDLRNLIRLAENALKKTDVVKREFSSPNRAAIVYRAHP